MHPEPENTAIKHKTARWLTDAIFYLAILFFAIGFNFSDRMVGNWYQQFLPVPAGGQIRDITFIDSLLGFAVSDSSIIKTTDGGDSWSVKLSGYYIFKRIQFLNSNTGFACGGNNRLFKTIDSGENWTIIVPAGIFPNDMAVVSEDTIFLVNSEGAFGGVFRTTNGGASWTQVNLAPNNPDRIYMYNARIGFICGGGQLRKTTNSGQNWNLLSGTGTGAFSDLFFIDSLTGWKAIAVGGGGWIMGKSTDGGINWINQPLPTGNFLGQGIVKFLNVDNDTIWGVGEALITGGSPPARGILYRTTNGGNNWLFQVPDTSIHIVQYWQGKMINLKFGWAYHVSPTGIHTTTGGDPIWLTPVSQISSEVPEEFRLGQNYPNPFNPVTNIKYQIINTKYVKLKVFDIAGREMITLVNEVQNAGTYLAVWNATGYASGIYFYSLIIDGKLIDTKKMILIK